MRVFPVALGCLVLAPLTFAATPAPSAAVPAMHRADFLVGRWQGQGWIVMGPDHTRHAFTETETIAPKLGGTLLLVEGAGRSATGKSIHEAVAVMTWNAQNHDYRWQAWSDGAHYIETTAQLGDDKLVWGFTAPHAGHIRFTITLDARGRWVESGEINPDGEHWIPFFGMTLTRQDKPPAK